MLARMQAIAGRSESVRTIASATLVVGARVGGTLATLLYTLLMARTMDAAAVGHVFAFWSTAVIAGTLATANIGTAAMRELTHARALGEIGLAAGFVRVAHRLLVVAVPLAMLAYALYHLSSLGSGRAGDEAGGGLPALALAALALPVLAWVQVNAGLAAALGRGPRSQLARALVHPLVALVGISALVAASVPLTPVAVLAIFAAGIALTALAQHALVRDAFADLTRDAAGVAPRTERRAAWIRAGLLLTPTRIMGENLKNLVIAAAALSLLAADVALVTVAFSLVAFLNFGIGAIEINLAPKVSAAIARGEARRRDRLLALGAALKLPPVLIAVALLWWLAEPILGLFGPDYVAAADTVRWFALMPLAKAAFGPCELVLQVHARRVALLVLSSTGIVAIVGAMALGASDGVAEAARGAALAYASLYAAMWLACRALTDVDPSAPGSLFRAMSGGKTS